MSDWHAATEPRADGRVTLRLYRFVALPGMERDQHDRAEYVISHEDAWHLFTNLAGQLRSEGDVRMRNAATGDCDTCKNHRLIDVPRTNGPGLERVYCPDCHDRYAAAEPAYPSWPEPD